MGQFDQFAVAIGETHIDRPGQWLAVLPRHAAGGRPSAVPHNGATAHANSLTGYWRLAKVKVASGSIGFQWDAFEVILIKKERR